jgi:hypothetical protein
MRQRRTQDSVLFEGMIENRDRYNGDVVIPLPDVSGMPAANRPGPNFFQEAIDGHARSANGALPKISCPVRNPDSEHSIALADRRQGALYGAWYETQLDLKLDRSYRHQAAYGTCAFVVMASEVLGRADIQVRDPLTAYPELRAPDDIRSPSDCGFLFARSSQWIDANYPNSPEYLRKSSDQGWDTLWDVVEWIDEYDVVIGVMGPRFPAYGYADARPYGYNAVELERWPNKAGRCTAIVPRRATLDRIMGQMTSMINYSDLYGRMMTLQLVATEKAIFPDLAVISRTGNPPTLVGNKWHDGRSGNVNMLIDAAIEVIGKEPGPGTMPMLQLMDQHIRGGSGGDLLGGGNGGMRTGAGIDALGDYQVNPMVAESQRIMQRSLTELNKVWIEQSKGSFGDKEFTVILGLPGSAKTVTYTPNKDFDSNENVVAYASPGADANKLAVALVQLEASKIISRKTARRGHPLVQDEDEEEQFVAIEGASDAVQAGLAQEISVGQVTTAEAARYGQLLAEGMGVFEARLQAAAEMAVQGPAPGTPGGAPPVGAPGPQGQPGAPIPPGLAQALAAQGAGPQSSPDEGVPTAQPGAMNLRHILQGVNEQVSPGAT